MIDFDKLKAAAELFEELKKITGACNSLMHVTIGERVVYGLSVTGHEYVGFNDIDDLIAKLKELTPPKTKYKVGDEIGFETNGVTVQAKVDEIIDSDYH